MSHTHIYDADGRQLCCTPQEGKIYAQADAQQLVEESCCTTTDKAYAEPIRKPSAHHHDHDGHDHAHDHTHETANKTTFQLFLPPLISLGLLLAGLALDHLIRPGWFSGWARIALYVAAYLPVGWPVIREMAEAMGKRDFFSEFLLMTLATVGAFAIGEYPEAVTVMLFYTVGEVFQTLAVKKAKGNIQQLLDQRPDEVTILENQTPITIKAAEAAVGSIVQLKPGEKLALDGELLSDSSTFNTAALTGESKPDTKQKGDAVLAGMINLNTVSLVRTTTAYADSKLSRILELVQNASAQKAPTELFIRKFAKIYTPIVVGLALAIWLLPYFFVPGYTSAAWLYRALVFLVISCPCALVISIPLGYFGGIGAAGRNGILVKGGNFLDVLAKVQQVVMDKTGTLTEGVFNVQAATFQPGTDQADILQRVNALESKSTHPVATAIHRFVGEVNHAIPVENLNEIAGHGLQATVGGHELLVGNFKLLDRVGVSYPVNPNDFSDTVIAIALDRTFAGYLTIADRLKDEAAEAIRQLKALNVQPTMLSGDKAAVVQNVAKQLGIPAAYGDLLPEDKVTKVKALKADNQVVAFVGDGVNDAPVVALSDVGMAMGGLGSDATIETADVVIQDDNPVKIPMAIRIGKKTKQIVIQNITLAFLVKAAVLLLGAGGLATMWEAVFADVGVALLAILNAVRIQRMTF